MITRRRRAAQRAYEDEVAYFEKHSDVPDNGNGNRHHNETAELGQGPLGASATSLGASPAAPDAYPDRAIHYGGNQDYSSGAYAPQIPAQDYAANAYTPQATGQEYYAQPYNPTDYGIEYPPGTAYSDAHHAPAPAQAQQSEAYNPFGSDTDAYGGYEDQRQPSPQHSIGRGSASNHPFADPANAVRTYTPPVQYPRGAVRNNYEPSVDSFYGAAGVGTGAGAHAA